MTVSAAAPRSALRSVSGLSEQRHPVAPIACPAAIPLPEGVTLPLDDLDDPQGQEQGQQPEKWHDLGLSALQ